VAFVSLTTMSRDMVEKFVEHCSIPWAWGYGVPLQTMAEFGALDRKSGLAAYEVRPTLYLVGPDGGILWGDRGAPMAHDDQDRLLRALDRAIEKALQ
jgi:hypothetical protein